MAPPFPRTRGDDSERAKLVREAGRALIARWRELKTRELELLRELADLNVDPGARREYLIARENEANRLQGRAARATLDAEKRRIAETPVATGDALLANTRAIGHVTVESRESYIRRKMAENGWDRQTAIAQATHLYPEEMDDLRAPWANSQLYTGEGGHSPDTAAQALHDEGRLADPTVDAFWDAVRGDIETIGKAKRRELDAAEAEAAAALAWGKQRHEQTLAAIEMQDDAVGLGMGEARSSIGGDTLPQKTPLVAMHFLSASHLASALRRGGLPSPSIAVSRDTEGWDLPNSYGDCLLFFKKDTVDPRKDPRNLIFPGDAMTPRHPKDSIKKGGLDHALNELRSLGWDALTEQTLRNEALNLVMRTRTEADDEIETPALFALWVNQTTGERLANAEAARAYAERFRNAESGVIEPWIKDRYGMGTNFFRDAGHLVAYSGKAPSSAKAAQEAMDSTTVKPKTSVADTRYATGDLMYAVLFSFDDIEAAREAIKNSEPLETGAFRAARERLADALVKPGVERNTTIRRFVNTLANETSLKDALALFEQENQWFSTTEEARQAFLDLVNISLREKKGYYEAKPRRIVGLDEITLAVIPSDQFKLKWELEKRGIPYETYPASDTYAIDQNHEVAQRAVAHARFSIGGLFTSSPALYDKPSLRAIGSGLGTRVFGWGLYASDNRGMVERVYSKLLRENEDLDDEARPSILEQVWWDNRPEDDKTHLLPYFDVITGETRKFVNEAIEGIASDYALDDDAVSRYFGEDWQTRDMTGQEFYDLVTQVIGENLFSPDIDPEQAASQALAYYDIDGIVYPVGVDRVEAGYEGNNYVAFSDEHLRVVNRWIWDEDAQDFVKDESFDRNAPEARSSIGGLYSGGPTAYNRPSLRAIGTNDAGRAYGWGLYATTERDMAEGYAGATWRELANAFRFGGKTYAELTQDDPEAARLIEGYTATAIAEKRARGYDPEALKRDLQRDRAWLEDYLADPENAPENMDAYPQSKQDRLRRFQTRLQNVERLLQADIAMTERGIPAVHEQLWWTNRPDGDESHLLTWDARISEGNRKRVIEAVRSLGLTDAQLAEHFGAKWDGTPMTGEQAYDFVTEAIRDLAKLEGDHEALASQLLARHDVDGTVRHFPAGGSIYVAFSDEHMRVVRRWVWNEETETFELDRSFTPPTPTMAEARATAGDDQAIAEAQASRSSIIGRIGARRLDWAGYRLTEDEHGTRRLVQGQDGRTLFEGLHDADAEVKALVGTDFTRGERARATRLSRSGPIRRDQVALAERWHRHETSETPRRPRNTSPTGTGDGRSGRTASGAWRSPTASCARACQTRSRRSPPRTTRRQARRSRPRSATSSRTNRSSRPTRSSARPPSSRCPETETDGDGPSTATPGTAPLSSSPTNCATR